MRGGKEAFTPVTDYEAGELYFLSSMPMQKAFSSDTKLYPRLDVGVGHLHADSQSSGWLAVGIDVVLSILGGAWELEGGFRPVLLFEHRFGMDDFGGPVQFSSHAGVTYNWNRFVLNYRFQHISNANIYEHNAGLELHLVGVGMRF